MQAADSNLGLRGQFLAIQIKKATQQRGLFYDFEVVLILLSLLLLFYCILKNIEHVGSNIHFCQLRVFGIWKNTIR